MLERVRGIAGVPLALAAYQADFAAIEARAASSWKLERRQEFAETDEPSWDAAVAGDWDAAMRLAAEDEHNEYGTEQRRLTERGQVRRRIRIVETPISDYLRWELPSLAVIARLGEQIRVGPPALVRGHETDGPVPEVIGFDDELMYQIAYDDRGALAGARRITAPEVVATCRREVLELWDRGEDIARYVRREVARLVPFLP